MQDHKPFSPVTRENHDERNPAHQAERESAVLSLPFDVFELYCDKSGPYSPIFSFLRRGNTKINSPRSLVFSILFRWTQPERDMCWLHRLLHHGQQVIVQLVQVHLLAQRGTVGCHDLGGVILAAIEAPINDALNALAQWLEQGGYDQC